MGKNSISVIIKTTNACNLKCKYCYDANNLERTDITLRDVDRLFRLLASEYSTINIIWHGGEPTLMGKDFYRAILNFQQKYTNDSVFVNKMQTNGTLIDSEWADFLVKNNFHIGISYDGGDITTGREKQNESLEGRNNIIKAGGHCGVVSVLNTQNINSLIMIYENYKKKQMNAQFNFIFPYGRALEKDNEYLIISEETYIKSMTAFFDYWLADKECNIRIDPFISYIQLLQGINSKCITGGCLYKFICMDNKGDIYPCGRIIMPQFCLGHINGINSIKELFYTNQFGVLLQSTVNRRNKCLQTCAYYQYCRGGCNSDAIMYGDVESNNHFACNIFRRMLSHISLKINEYKNNGAKIQNPFVNKIISDTNN